MSEKDLLIRNSTAEFLSFTAASGTNSIEVLYANENVWATQDMMAMLYGIDRSGITKHLKNIFEAGELNKDSVCAKFARTAADGKSYQTQFYSLEAIIAVGFRIEESQRAIQFRQWANRVLKLFSVRGYVLDRERMKNGAFLGEDYFEHLLEEIREIRASERRFYQKITDIYATAMDYRADAPTTQKFFATVQNKLHYAAHGHTAAEVIYERADAEKPFMGLTSFSGELPALKDIGVAKNYLKEDELKILNNLVSGYFDLAEINAIEHKPMYMADYVEQLDSILSSGNRKLLVGSGKVSHDQAIKKAKEEYRKYQEITLSPVEEEYLKSIKGVEKEVKKRSRTKK